MSVVRVAAQLRLVAATLLQKQKTLPLQKTVVRNAGRYLEDLTFVLTIQDGCAISNGVNQQDIGYVYRGHFGKEPASLHYLGEVLSFGMWYWILYHCWFEYHHLVPDHVYPDPTKFTDEELGIPPDDED